MVEWPFLLTKRCCGRIISYMSQFYNPLTISSANHSISGTIGDSITGKLGTIEAYISRVNCIPLLTKEREIELFKELRIDGNIDAARELVLSHLRLVVSVARQYLGYGISHADLIQEGNIGLMKAVKRFDPEKGVRLVSFAVHWIKAEIHEFIVKNWRLVKIASTKAQRKLFFNLRKMRPDGQILTPAQIDWIARKLNVRHKEVSEMEIRLSGRDLSIENQGKNTEEKYAPITQLSDNGQQEPTTILSSHDQQMLQTDGIGKALGSLDPRSRKIIESRWLQEENTSTLKDLSLEFGVSAERIRQIEVAAMKKMRQVLCSHQ